MDLNKWNVREFKIEDDTGDSAFILYRPLTQGWRTRHLEVSLKIQRSFSVLQDQQEQLKGEGDTLSDDSIGEIISAQSETQGLLMSYQKDMLMDLVVGCRDLTIDGEEPTKEVLVGAIISMEDIAASLCAHIAEEGNVSDEEGKS